MRGREGEGRKTERIERRERREKGRERGRGRGGSRFYFHKKNFVFK